jgi:capsular exopolysaccharide synthesis family protein
MANRSDMTTPPKKPEGRLSAAVLLNAIRHYPFLFLGLLALSAAVAVGVWFFMPLPKHTAAVVFHVLGQTNRVITIGDRPQPDINSYRQLEAEMVKRRLVLTEALKKLRENQAPNLNNQPDPLVWLDKYLRVESRIGSEFIRVYLEGDNPEEMLAIINAVTGAYLEDLKGREKGMLTRKLENVNTAYEKTLKEVEAKRKSRDLIAQSLNTTDAVALEMRRQAMHDTYNALRRELLEVDKHLELAKAKLPPEGQEETVTVTAEMVEEEVGKSTRVQDAEAKVTAAKDSLIKIMQRVGEGSDLLTKARAEVKTTEEARDKIRTEVRKTVEGDLKERLKRTQRQLVQQQKEKYDELLQKKKTIEQQIQYNQTELERHGNHRNELESLTKDIGYREKLLDDLAKERDTINLEMVGSSRVEVTEEPHVAAGIEGFRRLRTTLLASVGLFSIGFALLVWWELRSRRMIRTDEVAQSLGLPLLGTLPPWSSEAPGSHGDLVEAIDSARTLLLHSQSGNQPLRTLVVTSALSGEGKTSLAGHLAISLTRAGYRTLLVDGDVRAPSVHKVFDLPSAPGLCEVLRNEAVPEDVIVDTKVPGLSVMSAGKWSLVARQALVGDRWGIIRRQLERQYDFVVLDSAPLLLTTDTLLLTRGADGVVLSVLLGVSRLGSVAHSQEKLSSLGVRVLGVVVNGARTEYPEAYGNRYEYPETADETVPLTRA